MSFKDPRKRYWFKPMPITSVELHKHDNLHWQGAVYAAWATQGDAPLVHKTCQIMVRRLMPLLARALDRGVYGRELEDSYYGALQPDE